MLAGPASGPSNSSLCALGYNWAIDLESGRNQARCSAIGAGLTR